MKIMDEAGDQTFVDFYTRCWRLPFRSCRGHVGVFRPHTFGVVCFLVLFRPISFSCGGKHKFQMDQAQMELFYF